MKIRGIGKLFLASAIGLSVASFDAATAVESVQWAGGGNATVSVSASRDLRWSTPKVKSTAPQAVVTADHAAFNHSEAILQVQYSADQYGGDKLAQVPSMTPARRDLVYPDLRPQSNTPPAGATLIPPVPQPSTLSPPVEQPRNEPASSELRTPTLAPNAEPPQPQTKPMLLRTPDVQRPDTPIGIARDDDSEQEVHAAPQPETSFRSAAGSVASPMTQPCPDHAGFKSIRDISYDIRPVSNQVPTECPLVTTPYVGRHFNRTCFTWKASALCTKASYFEDVQLERYGHSICPILQPVISGAKFFLTVPVLPYKMGLTPPNECVYTLGHYRVGNCAPHMLDPLPISIRAILFEGAAIGAGVALIP